MLMILRSTFLCGALVLATLPAMAVEHTIFLLGGQSNMQGYGTLEELPTTPVNLQAGQSDVRIYELGWLRNLAPRPNNPNDHDFGPEILFGRNVADALPDENIVLIKGAWGGTNLYSDWDPASGSRFNNFISTVTAGLNAVVQPGDTYKIAGMLWTQGESDARGAETSEQYEENLTGFIAAVRDLYGADMPFFLSRLSDVQTNIAPVYLANVRTGQANVAAIDPNAYLVDTDGFGILPDNLHFDASGQIDLGEAFATSYLATVPEPTTLMMIGLGVAVVTRRRVSV